MKLYVIGNGFDLYHGLDTKYTSFGRYLKNNYYRTYDLLLEYFGFEDLELDPNSTQACPLWSEFETHMSGLCIQSVLGACEELLPNYASDSFRDRDRSDFAIEIERIVKLLTTQLLNAFKEFISNVQYPDLSEIKVINLDSKAHFLNFNYTDTLSEYYGITDEKVVFIHGKAKDKETQLVLGHGIDPEKFQESPSEPPEGLSDEDYEQWEQDQADQFDYSYELGKQEINNYFVKSFKDTSTVIRQNSDFFSCISNVDEIYILGHSLAEVDLPYFIKLKNSVRSNVKWVVTCRSLTSKEHHLNVLKRIGINSATAVRIEDI
ncbi:bacteriophage abortive infection AbiH family protein [Acinetobacter bereziniae]|uniref:bacteriophage abortive infection AbiH family protein n=1 Tax=Acinetobacter bereziniae TaxID=106648 RepID=UPI00300B164E